MNSVVAIHTSAPDEGLAQKIADNLLSSHLAACVQILPAVKSYYHWNGKREISTEYPLWIKTHKSQTEVVLRRLKELHSYEIPEILVFPASTGLKEYLDWIERETFSKV